MGMRIHTTDVWSVGVEYANIRRIAELYGERLQVTGPALIIEDGGNMEALVICGPRKEMRDFLTRALSSLDASEK